MRIARKAKLGKLLEISGDVRELIHLPRGSVVMVEQSEKRLLLSALVAVEGPRKNSLRSDHER